MSLCLLVVLGGTLAAAYYLDLSFVVQIPELKRDLNYKYKHDVNLFAFLLHLQNQVILVTFACHLDLVKVPPFLNYMLQAPLWPVPVAPWHIGVA